MLLHPRHLVVSITLALLACSGGVESEPDAGLDPADGANGSDAGNDQGGEAEPDPGCTPTMCPFDYSTFAGGGAPVSLRRDLLGDKPPTSGSAKLGIFRKTCNFASDCHGRQSGEASLYLGPPATDTSNQPIPITDDEITQMLTGGKPLTLLDGGLSDPIPRGIINVASKTNPDVVLVKPGDPENSFLMRKIDACYEGLEARCTPQSITVSGHPCGDRMPESSKTLCEDERDMVRRWIAQGAMNN